MRGKERRVRKDKAPPRAGARAASSAVAVVTGGSSGIGYAIAREFARREFTVIVSSRDEGKVRECVKEMRKEFANVSGATCDVGKRADVDELMKRARESVRASEGVDIVHWVNAAGMVTKNKPLHEVSAEEVVAVVEANLIGPLLACRAAIALALELGANTRVEVWNFGFSNWGANLSRSAATHKATKAGLTQLTKSLNDEVKALNSAKLARVSFHQLSPGLVLTKLLLKDASAASKKVFNALAEEPEDIARFLVDEMVAVEPGSTTAVEYLTPMSAVSRMIRELPNIITNRGGRHFDSTGARVKAPNARYDADGVRKLPFET